MNESVPMWAFGGLLGLFQAVIVIMLTRQGAQMDKNTDAVNKLAIDIPTTYATKADSLRHHEDDRREFDLIHGGIAGMRERVHALDLRTTAIDGDIASARAALKGG